MKKKKKTTPLTKKKTINKSTTWCGYTGRWGTSGRGSAESKIR